MKKTILCSLLFIAALVLGSGPLAAQDGATMLAVDAAHSTVGFEVPIAGGLAKVRGKFSSFTVTLSYNAKDVTKSTVKAVIKADSIDTGIAGRDNHLKNPDFFEVEKYPEITFTSKSVTKKGKQLAVTGDFTMHGVTQEITIPFTLTGDAAKLKAGEPPIGVLGRITIDRRVYGISYARKDDPNFLGNMIDIELSLLMTKPRPPRS
jgi:polyisoprenoid-binding protein YceI